MSTIISANELKTQGVGIFEKTIKDDQEAIISLRGKPKYIVMTMKHYNKFREYELENAVNQAKKEIANGDYFEESVADHMKRIGHG